MSESTKGTRPLLVSREQARQLVEWAEGIEHIPHFARIVKQGHFAYFTDRHVVVRWDVEGLDVPDGSWIDLLPSGPDDCDGEPDTLTNMADWSQKAGEYECCDLMDAKRWREPDGEKIQGFEKLFTRAQTAVTPLSFDRQELDWMILMVTGCKDWEVALAPTREDGRGPWWVMGHDRRVAGLCMQHHGFNPSGDDLPEAYQEKKEEGKQMSDWYSDLDQEEMAGKHVRVRFDNGIVFEGPLVYDKLDDFVRLGPMRNVPCTEGLPVEETGMPPVLTRSSDGHWQPFPDVKSITHVWDERDWDQLDHDDADRAEAAVVNGRIWGIEHIDGDGMFWLDRPGSSCCVDRTMVSVFLRARSSTPVRPGFYRDRNGAYWMKPYKEPWWCCLDSSVEPRGWSYGQMKLLMPLTPVKVEFKEVD